MENLSPPTYLEKLEYFKNRNPQYFLQYSLPNLDVGCGDRPEHWLKDSVTIDMFQYGQTIQHDITQTPWPIADNTFCGRLQAQHIMEHIREGEHFIGILNEIARVGCNGSQFYMVCPHWTSANHFRDPYHYRPISENTLDGFQEGSAIHFGPGYDIHCKFRKVNIWVDTNRDVHFDLRIIK
jgi:hypothetical protein